MVRGPNPGAPAGERIAAAASISDHAASRSGPVIAVIAILRAMGGSGRWIATVFLTIGAVIGLIGTLTGMVFGIGTCLCLTIFPLPMPRDYYLESLPVQMDPMTIVTIVVMAGVLTVAASLFPTVKAARMIPSEGLRHE